MTVAKTWTLDETKVHVTIRCPCGATVTAGTDLHSKQSFVMHSLPMCADYERLEVTDYLKWARLHGAVTLSGGPDRSRSAS